MAPNLARLGNVEVDNAYQQETEEGQEKDK